MKITTPAVFATLVLLVRLPQSHAQPAAFTYQGRLNDGVNPATGNYDLQFTIHDAPGGGGIVGGPLTNSSTEVSSGLFTVTLDFGASVFTGADRWLEIGVRTNGGGVFATLTPRQQLTSTPYAVTAGNVTGTVAASQLNGAISVAQLPASVVTNGASGVNISGTFSGNGAGVTNLDLSLSSDGLILSSGGFVLTSSPGVGGFPNSVTAADVNGDGKVDLISANNGAPMLTVLTNNGSGGFALSSSPGVGAAPSWVTAADVNGDGKVDLISANSADNTLSVLTNNGSGGFVLSSSPGVGTAPISVTTADVNGDSRADLISANITANSLTVLTNNGSGDFVLVSSPDVGTGPRSVTATDVNGDAKADLISVNQTANTLTVLTNNGSGGFVLSSSPGVGVNPFFVTTTDANGDGKVDLVSANHGANTLTVLTNNGSGGFALSSSPGVGLNPYTVTTADVNGDGKVDLVSANSGARTLTVLTNNGSGGFGLFSSLGVGLSPSSVTAADVNADGRVDLINANAGANTLSVLFNKLMFTGNFAGNFPNGKVGIGTTSPQANVHVVTTGEGIRLQGQSAGFDNLAWMSFVNGIGTRVGYVGDGGADNAVLLAADNGSVVLNTAAGRVLTATSTGRVGIGTTNPTASLDVAGEIKATSLSLPVANQLWSLGGNAGTTPGTHFLGTTDAQPLEIRAAGVGIGTASPIGTLDVRGGNSSYVRVDSLNGDVKVNGGNDGVFGIINEGFASGRTDILGQGVARLTVANTGNVGIGTISPTARLEVVGEAKATTLSFGSTLGQKINLYSTTYGIGIQSGVQYSRVGTSGSFAWYDGGIHNDFAFNAGGGVLRMALNSGGLEVNGVLVSSSDRNMKENFAPVQPSEVLEKVVALPLSSWNFKATPATRHIGPMAQDFYAAFDVGPDDKHIATVDADGVALAAIQGLNKKVEEKERRIRELEEKVSELQDLVREFVGTKGKRP